MGRSRALVIAAANLHELRVSRDFWLPMLLMTALFFAVLPVLLLGGVVRAERIGGVERVGNMLEDRLPAIDGDLLRGGNQSEQRAYGLAVYLLAPLVVVVPMTICSAIGANTIVGEREKGTGEFLAPSRRRSARSLSAR